MNRTYRITYKEAITSHSWKLLSSAGSMKHKFLNEAQNNCVTESVPI